MLPHFESLRPLRIGIVLALLALVLGFGLGAAFGVLEDDLKGHLAAEGRAVLDTVYGGDANALKSVTDKAWVYLQRAHLHANGLGTTSLVLILLLAALPAGVRAKSATSCALGLGALGYGLYWLLAGLRAPRLGGTGAAKESLEWLAIPSVAFCALGLTAVLFLSLRAYFTARG